MSKSIQHLEQMKKIISDAIHTIENGSKEVTAIKLMSVGLDKKYASLVKDLGGLPYYFKKTNETSFELAMGEVT